MADAATRQAGRFVTGVQYSVCDFVNAAARELGMAITWRGEGVEKKGYHPSPANGRWAVGEGERCIVQVDPRYFRPTEVETLLGDASKAKYKLGWTPKISFDELVKKHGYVTFNSHEQACSHEQA